MRLSFEDVHKLYVFSFKSQFGRELVQTTGVFLFSKKYMTSQILKEDGDCHSSHKCGYPNN